MPDIDQLRELTGQLRPPPYSDLVAVSRTRRRRRATVASLSAAAVVAVVVGATSLTGRSDTAPPVGPSPSPAPPVTETTAPGDPTVNGRIQSLDEYLERAGVRCGDCYGPGSVFDQDTGRVLLVDTGVNWVDGIRVVGRHGLVARLTCPDDFACPQSYVMDLGPAADELSVLVHDTVQVLSFDGTLRRTVDLSGALDEDDNAHVLALAWAPDARRLAVETGGTTNGSRPAEGTAHRRIWLTDVDGGSPQLVYTASSTAEFPRVALTRMSWSPDGSRLGFVEGHWNMAAELGRPTSSIEESTRAVSLSLPSTGQGTSGAARTVYEYPKEHPQYDDDATEVFLWSPDGGRVAVRFYDQFLELSAADGTVITEHPFVEGDLIWPRADR